MNSDDVVVLMNSDDVSVVMDSDDVSVVMNSVVMSPCGATLTNETLFFVF
jgi:hypothetical protein